MEKQNKFYVGQEVVAIQGTKTGSLKVGDSDIITWVGEVLDTDGIVKLGLKLKTLKPTFLSQYFHQKYFVPVDYTKAKQVTFKEIVESVPSFTN